MFRATAFSKPSHSAHSYRMYVARIMKADNAKSKKKIQTREESIIFGYINRQRFKLRNKRPPMHIYRFDYGMFKVNMSTGMIKKKTTTQHKMHYNTHSHAKTKTKKK